MTVTGTCEEKEDEIAEEHEEDVEEVEEAEEKIFCFDILDSFHFPNLFFTFSFHLDLEVVDACTFLNSELIQA